MDSGVQGKIIRSLGHGPLGESWLAEKPADQPGDNRLIVMKQIVGSSDERFAIRERFAEQKVHAIALEAAGIVPFTHCLDSAEHLWLVRDYVEGEPLALTIVDHQLTPNGIHNILSELARGLETVQKFGLGHGHLWLTNIFVLADGSVRITDLGIRPSIAAIERTKPGHLVAFPPERLRDEGSFLHEDCYAIGALFHTLVAGHPPFHTTSITDVHELRERILGSCYLMPEVLELPERRAEKLLLESLITTDAADRITSAPQIRASFDALADLRRFPERSAEKNGPSPRQLIWLSVSMLVLIVIWLLYFFG